MPIAVLTEDEWVTRWWREFLDVQIPDVDENIVFSDSFPDVLLFENTQRKDNGGN